MPSFCTPDTEDAAVKSQLETVAEEYNHLLVSQLESQRRYYEVRCPERKPGLACFGVRKWSRRVSRYL